MIDPTIGLLKLSDLNIYDGVVVLQIIEKLLRSGAVTGREIAHVASLRVKIAEAIKAASGQDIDNMSQSQARAND